MICRDVLLARSLQVSRYMLLLPVAVYNSYRFITWLPIRFMMLFLLDASLQRVGIGRCRDSCMSRSKDSVTVPATTVIVCSTQLAHQTSPVRRAVYRVTLLWSLKYLRIKACVDIKALTAHIDQSNAHLLPSPYYIN